jgi:hypothetical protein
MKNPPTKEELKEFEKIIWHIIYANNKIPSGFWSYYNREDMAQDVMFEILKFYERGKKYDPTKSRKGGFISMFFFRKYWKIKTKWKKYTENKGETLWYEDNGISSEDIEDKLDAYESYNDFLSSLTEEQREVWDVMGWDTNLTKGIPEYRTGTKNEIMEKIKDHVKGQ